MIFELILLFLFKVVGELFTWLLDLAPAIPAPVAAAFATAGEVFDWLAGWDTWLPLDVALICVGVVFVCYAYSLLLGLARVIISYLTLGGGAT